MFPIDLDVGSATFSTTDNVVLSMMVASIGSITWVESDQYTFTFKLTMTGYSQEIDVSTFSCISYDSTGTIIDQVDGATLSGRTTTVVGVEQTVSNDLAISVSDTDAGAESVSLTFTYITAAPFQASSWIYMTVPKANRFYDTGANTGSALSLTSSLDGASFTLGSGSFTITGNALTPGSNYDDDIWAFKIADAATAAAAGETIVLTVSITNPPCVYNLIN